MAVTQESRYRMHQRLEEVLGDEPATTLMEHLPPTGWADMATKQDVAHATELLSQRIHAVDERLTVRMDALDERMTNRVEALEQKFVAALSVEVNSVRTDIALSRTEIADSRTEFAEARGDMFKFMIVQVVAFYAANVALVGAAVTLVKG